MNGWRWVDGWVRRWEVGFKRETVGDAYLRVLHHTKHPPVYEHNQ